MRMLNWRGFWPAFLGRPGFFRAVAMNLISSPCPEWVCRGAMEITLATGYLIVNSQKLIFF